MNKSLLTLILVSLLIYSPVQAKDHEAFTPVKKLFAAMSAFDEKAMHETGTEDFQLLEHGEVWSMQKLADAIKPNGKPYQRRNFFQVIKTVENKDSVWFSYWNKAEFSGENGRGEVVWLESAVMSQSEGEWKLQMLHSTRLDKKNHPNDVQWKEYVAQ